MNKIILTGYMGSGKSTIGKMLSENIRIPFYDLDELIEDHENKSIKEIFTEKGEIYFRKIESQILNEFISNKTEFVLALGGGTPCYANNHIFLQIEDVSSIYLKASKEELVNRLKNEKENRPLLSNFTVEELGDYIRKHLFDRNYYYYQAKSTILLDGKSKEQIVDEIKSILT